MNFFFYSFIPMFLSCSHWQQQEVGHVRSPNAVSVCRNERYKKTYLVRWYIYSIDMNLPNMYTDYTEMIPYLNADNHGMIRMLFFFPQSWWHKFVNGRFPKRKVFRGVWRYAGVKVIAILVTSALPRLSRSKSRLLVSIIILCRADRFR